MSTRPTLTGLNEEPRTDAKPLATQGSFMLSLNEQPANAAHAKGASKINSFNIMLLAMVLGSASLILGMRKYGLANASAAAEFKIDYERTDEEPERVARQNRALARLDAEKTSPATTITSRSAMFSPFFEQKKQESKIGVSDPNDLSARQKLEAQRRLEDRVSARKTAFGKLKLESILNGVKPVARISKETVAVGDTVDSIFKVMSIKDRSVELMCDGEVFVLELGGKINAKDGKRSK